MDGLTDIERERLLTFQEISQIEDVQLSLQILQENNWNIDSAIDNFMSFGSRSSGNNYQQPEPPRMNSSFRPAPIHRNNPQTTNNSSHRSSDSNNENLATGSNNENNSSSLVDYVLTPLKWLFQTQPVSINPDSDTRKFISEFNSEYSSQHPIFHDRSYQSAVATAFGASKLLLVYLHSPMHEDTTKFCLQTLCTQSFSNFANDNVVTWAGKVWDPEAYGLSIQLRASAFPFLALLVCQSERVVQVVCRIQGHSEEADLIEKLRNTIAVNSQTVARIQTEAARRQEFSLLREQQDREYREAEEADRRERERRENEERERILREQEEQRQREEAIALELKRKQNYENDMARRKSELGTEPGQSEPEVAVVRFQLPQGAKLSRRFKKSDSVQKIYDYILVNFFDQGVDIKNISLATHFPKIELTDMNQTVEAAGLFPRGMLYVQNLDA